jgi:hypothetical protein
MANLASWQKITRVLPGQPFGDKKDGNATISSDPNTRTTAVATINTTGATLGAGSLANGDIFAIHQDSGAGVGQWEFNMVVSGGGTTSIVCKRAFHYEYVAGASVIKIPRYDVVTLGSWTVSEITFIVAKTSIAGSGTLNGTGTGFGGGNQNIYTKAGGGGGNGGTGGGGGTRETPGGGGGGGGGGANGTTGAGNGSNPGGGQTGSTDLITFQKGGGGGGGGGGFSDPGSSTNGANGGNVLWLISKSVDISSVSIVMSGNNAVSPSNSDGGSGGGGGAGCIGICAMIVILGTNKAVALGGNGGTNGQHGGNGGIGNIAVHHSGVVTGTTNPTFTDITDANLIEKSFLGGMI